jgi:hypothetical protein
MSEQNEKLEQPKHVVFRLAVTHTGDDEEPMVAVRVTADGKEVSMPFALVLGGLQLSKVGDNPVIRAAVAGALQQLAQGLAIGVIQQAQEAVAPAPAAPPAPPSE